MSQQNELKLANKQLEEGNKLEEQGKYKEALELFKQKVNPLEIMKQLRHKDLTTTQIYCQSLYSVNREIKALDNDLLGDNVLAGLI